MYRESSGLHKHTYTHKKKLLELINAYNKIIGYKINI